MGLLKPEPELFTAEWVEENRAIPESGMNCTVVVSRPGDPGKWDPATGEYTDATNVVLFTTKARVQPLRSAVPKEVPGNDTVTQTVLVSYPVAQTTLVNLQDIVKVTESPLNSDLLRYTLRVKEPVDSGNILERTIQCEVVVNG